VENPGRDKEDPVEVGPAVELLDMDGMMLMVDIPVEELGINDVVLE
jgi:hypothetical protein